MQICPSHVSFPKGTDVTKTKFSQRWCSSDVKKRFSGWRLWGLSLSVTQIYIAEILASFEEDRFLLPKGKLRIILKKSLPNIWHCRIKKKFTFFLSTYTPVITPNFELRFRTFYSDQLWGGEMAQCQLRALAFHQCLQGLILTSCHMWVEFVAGSCLAPRGFMLVFRFFSLHKNQT